MGQPNEARSENNGAAIDDASPRVRAQGDSRWAGERWAGERAGEWAGEDLNLRRLCRQIYSLLPLAARAPTREEVEDSVWACRPSTSYPRSTCKRFATRSIKPAGKWRPDSISRTPIHPSS